MNEVTANITNQVPEKSLLDLLDSSCTQKADIIMNILSDMMSIEPEYHALNLLMLGRLHIIN